MIDIHSHIIFGVDDGPSNIKESIRMVLQAEKLGVKDIIATPHFNNLLLNSNRIVENFSTLSSRIADCDVKLHIGYEVFINPLMIEKVKELKAKTLNNSSYILFELPFDHIPVYCSKLLQEFHSEKIIPILAHPERNRVFIRNVDSFINFIENGCLVQIDAGSIVGAYGKEAKRFAKQVIKLNLAQFIASDAHCTEDYNDWYLSAYNQVKRWAGEEYTNQLFNENAKNIIFNENAENVILNVTPQKIVFNVSARRTINNNPKV
jgi:protein-tyrosine phosphatase